MNNRGLLISFCVLVVIFYFLSADRGAKEEPVANPKENVTKDETNGWQYSYGRTGSGVRGRLEIKSYYEADTLKAKVCYHHNNKPSSESVYDSDFTVTRYFDEDENFNLMMLYETAEANVSKRIVIFDSRQNIDIREQYVEKIFWFEAELVKYLARE